MSTGSQSVRTLPGAWVRADGQSGRDNPALAAQFEADKAACSRPGTSAPDRACMDQRGYLLVADEREGAAVQGGAL